jgi:adenosine kinase
MGCVGQDKYQQLLHDAASKAGLLLSYQVQSDSEERIPTGTCAVLITGNNRLIEKEEN